MRIFSTAVLAVCVATPAFADVTVTSQVAGKGAAKMAAGQTVTYIKGLKMRADSTAGGSNTSVILDVENQKMITLDHAKKQAQVHNMAELRQNLDKAMKGGVPAATVTPNGRTAEVAGQTCTGYDILMTMPMAVGPDPSMKMSMSGPVCIARGAPGTDDFTRFYLAAAERGFIFSDPRAAKAAPQQSRGMAELYRRMAEIGGIPYRMEMSMKVEGQGPMADMMNKMMANSSFTTTVQSVTTDAIPADRFDVPAGYAVQSN